ncbi:hypothetical protein EB796_021693 [Bugula neritina]|uniref:Uncharacterized protein n=1 Tax=Bugula neritina TaxID=10212 RepID=A0A7J7J2F5_BUGNE|nr:hypothetical protein EB796_021693 [Bugula neritina]
MANRDLYIVFMLVSFLLSSYGAVDISKISQNKAVVIVSNQICARRILEAFQSHDKYAVVRYNPWRHSILANRILWTGAILSAGICTLALIRNVKKQLLS